MSQLSESQQLKAEQNRLKALQIRQQRIAASQGSHISPGGSQTAALPKETTSNAHETSQVTFRTHQSAPGTTGVEAGTKTLGTSPSSLPISVMKRIEENKRKALERRDYLKKIRAEQGEGVTPVPSATTNTSAAVNHHQTTRPVSSASVGTPAARNSLQTSSHDSQHSTCVPKSTAHPSGKKAACLPFSLSNGGGK